MIQRSAFDSSKIKQKIKQTPNYQNKSKGPIKASYELPTKNWQVKYTFNSPKTVQNGSRFRRSQEESSEYGTMENYEQALPHINLNDHSNSFNDISIGNYRENTEIFTNNSYYLLPKARGKSGYRAFWTKYFPYRGWLRPTSPRGRLVGPPWPSLQVN